MSERSAFRIPIRLNMRYGENGTYHDGIVNNMSESGICVLTEHISMTDNSLLRIELPVKNKHLILSGKLARVFQSRFNKRGLGIMLIDPPQEYIDYIEELLLTL